MTGVQTSLTITKFFPCKKKKKGEFDFLTMILSTISCYRYQGSSESSKVKKLAVATTKQDGTFQTELPSDSTTQTPTSPSSCLTKILGGPDQIYAFQKNMVSKVSKLPSESNSYTTSTPLVFYSSCPLARDDDAKCRARSAGTGSSKTVDLPLPPEWGLAPSSYYMPFIPIIGIP